MLINAHSSLPVSLVAKSDIKDVLKVAGLAVSWMSINILCVAYLANRAQENYELIGQRVIFEDRDYRWLGTYTSADFAVECVAGGLLGLITVPTITAIALTEMFGCLDS